jgi:DNA replication protein DnaC
VPFELISARYERRSLLITASRLFGEWGKIFPMSRAIAAAGRSNANAVPVAHRCPRQSPPKA